MNEKQNVPLAYRTKAVQQKGEDTPQNGQTMPPQRAMPHAPQQTQTGTARMPLQTSSQQGAMPHAQQRMQQGQRTPMQMGAPQGAMPNMQPNMQPNMKANAQQPMQPSTQAPKPMPPRIGTEQVAKAMQILQRYKDGKAALDHRIVDNELWFKMAHWKQYRNRLMDGKAQPASGWLFNSIANKHADAMDSFPAPSILPRAADDTETAKQLSSILPVLLDHCDYEQVYSDTWWYKLKQGTGVKGVFWDTGKSGGLGDVAIRKMDLLMLFWEPGIMEIQDSPHFFSLALVDNTQLMQEYPEMRGKTGRTLNVATYVHDDAIDTSDKSIVVDWYYKVRSGGHTLLHYCKFCNGAVLYASENDEKLCERGFYDHGKYPFVFDTLFVEEDTPAGFGYIDVMKDCQTSIDKMNHVMQENAILASKPRYFLADNTGINEEELSDFSRDVVHFSGRLTDENFRQQGVDSLASNSLTYLNNRITELKETSGNRDFSQGGTSSGVTAASAIAALQEAGSKLSRDMLKSAYRSFVKECYLCIELMRQFYDEPRLFRITGEGGTAEFSSFSNKSLRAQPMGTAFGQVLGYRSPEFDVVVSAAKKNTFSQLSQNETAKELYRLGLFLPDNAVPALACLEMMEFEGVEKVRTRIADNKAAQDQKEQEETLQAQYLAQMMQAASAAPQNVTAATQKGGTP